MVERHYSRVPGRNLIQVARGDMSPLDQECAVPILAESPDRRSWGVLVIGLAGVGLPEELTEYSTEGPVTVAVTPETAMWIASCTAREDSPLSVELADECFSRAPGEAIRFLTEACVICLAGLDEASASDTAHAARPWQRLRNALLEVSVPYRSLPLLRELRDDLESRLPRPVIATRDAAPTTAGRGA